MNKQSLLQIIWSGLFNMGVGGDLCAIYIHTKESKKLTLSPLKGRNTDIK